MNEYRAGYFPSRPRLSPGRRVFAGATALVLAISLGRAVAWAQPAQDDVDEPEMSQPVHGDPHGGAAGILDLLDRELKLTASQHKSVKAIVERSKKKHDELEMQRRAIDEQVRKLHQADSEKIRALLDDDQKERFDELNVRLRHRREMPHPGMPMPHPDMPRSTPMRPIEPGGPSPANEKRESPDGPPEMMPHSPSNVPQSAPAPDSKK